MKPISKETEIAEKVVRQYAFGLSCRMLEGIVPILHPDFKFVYRLGNGSGHGIRTDVRHIGHLYKTFSDMRKEGLTINTDLCYMEKEGVMFLGIKLLPPHNRDIIFPMDYQVIESVRNRVPENEVYLLPRVKNGLLYKIECYTYAELYHYGVKLLEK